MHPRDFAARDPCKPAVFMADSGVVVTHAALSSAANRAARLFRTLGLHRGDGIAICLENQARYFELCWAAHNAGLYYTPISTRLKTSEIGYILADCGARVLITSAALREVVAELAARPEGARR